MSEQEASGVGEQELEMMLEPGKKTVTTWSKFGFAWSSQAIQVPSPNGGEPIDKTISFLIVVDHDTADEHHFIFSEEARQELLRKMTGGVVIP